MNGGADAGIPGIGAVCVSLFLILALLAAAAWLARRLQLRGWRLGGSGSSMEGQGAIHIVVLRRIGRDSCLSIVEVAGERFLLASGRGGVTAMERLRGDIDVSSP